MHGRIYQIETHPVANDEFLNIGWDLEDIKPEIADYVDEDPNPAYSIACLKVSLNARCGNTITIFENSFILHEGFREVYFQRPYEKFQEYLRKLENCSLADFATGKNWMSIYNLKDVYECTTGDHVWSNGDYLETRDKFMRCAEPEVRYYFGGTLDYHR